MKWQINLMMFIDKYNIQSSFYSTHIYQK